MIARAQTLFQNLHLSLLGAGVLLFIQIILLRLLSTGRYGSLNAAENALPLWMAHTSVKGLVIGALFLLLIVLLRQLTEPALTEPRLRGSLLGLQVILFAAILGLQTLLPATSELTDRLLSLGDMLAYSAAIGFLALLVGIGVTLILPAQWVWAWARPEGLIFIATVVIVTLFTQTKLSWELDGIREVIESTTLTLTLWMYGLFGTVTPDLVMIQGTPLMSAPGFAIKIDPNCSGYQGVASSFLLLSAYCTLERNALIFRRAAWIVLAAVIGTFLLNALRISLLFHVGVELSPVVAERGFHSNFGTLSVFIATAVGILTLEQGYFRKGGSRLAAKAAPDPISSPDPGREILALSALLISGIVTGLSAGVINWLYPLVVLVGIGATIWVWDRLKARMADGISLAGVLVGIAVFGLWIWMIPPDAQRSGEIADALWDAGPALVTLWITARIIGSCILVPVLEELAFRGALVDVTRDLLPKTLPPMAIQATLLVLPSIAFGLLHANIAAGTMAGLAFGALALWRGGIADAILAHAITNFLIAVTAMGLGYWSYW